jgi:O-antigen ligase
LPFSFEYNFNPQLGTDIPDEFFMLLAGGLFFLYFIFSPKIISKNTWHHPLVIFLLINLVWLTVTVVFSSYNIISLKFFLAKCWYIGAFVMVPLIVFKQKETIKRSASILAFSMLAVVLIALMRHATLGFHFAEINNAVAPFFRNHVNYSAMLVCTIPIFFAFYKLSQSKKKKQLILIAIVVLLTALFFSYARGAWLALLAGIIAYWLIRKKLLFLSFLTAFIITITLLVWLKSNDRYLQFAHDYKTTVFHKDFKEHLIATYKLKDVSTAERFYRWIAGVRMIKDNPLTGFGPNTFYNNYKPYAIPAFETWVSDNKEHSTVHNYFLLITIEQGIPGLIFFLLLLGGSLYYAQQLYHRVQDIFYKTMAATIGVILSMLIVVNFLSDLIETDKVGSIFFLCLATLIVTDINTRKESNSSADIQSIS